MTNELWQCHCRNRGIKFFFNNCGNGIAKNGGEKSYEIYERVKKKVVMSTIFLQHFHNKSHMISYQQFKKICDKLIMAMVLPKQMRDIKKSTHILILSVFFLTETVWFVTFFYDKKKWNGIVAMALSKQEGKRFIPIGFWQCHCQN